MTAMNCRAICLRALLLGAFHLAAPMALLASPSTTAATPPSQENTMSQHPYVGMWVTDDGQIRHELLPNNRYDEARGTRESAYQGRYEVSGTHIDYWDDTGFTADGEFVDRDTLPHGGMIFRRR